MIDDTEVIFGCDVQGKTLHTRSLTVQDMCRLHVTHNSDIQVSLVAAQTSV